MLVFKKTTDDGPVRDRFPVYRCRAGDVVYELTPHSVDRTLWSLRLQRTSSKTPIATLLFPLDRACPSIEAENARAVALVPQILARHASGQILFWRRVLDETAHDADEEQPLAAERPPAGDS